MTGPSKPDGGRRLREFVLQPLMSAILLKQNLTNNRKRRKKNVDVEKGGESGEFDLEANGSCRPERGPSLLTAVGYRWLVVNKTLWERAIRRRGCGINWNSEE